MAESRIIGGINFNALLAFVFGVLFISVLLVLVVFVKDLSDLACWVVVVVMALAGAGFAVVLPGRLVFGGGYIKAGGALAVFVVILINQPSIVISAGKLNAKWLGAEADVTSIVRDFLAKVDRGELDQAWDSLDDVAKKTIAADRVLYRAVYENGRYALGNVVERSSPIGGSVTVNPPGYPEGIYKVSSYRTRFKDGCHEEVVSVRSDNGREWAVFGHNISSILIPCPD
ncbi:DUF4019 domain-containing protein [Pseudomonas sp. 273]|uniref:DUF4019 domain-containing protein n=1 Tax=Pseudomonas sp. 273 TaxID=75692 RepID=UPI0023D7F091|nr:DUF4019 domain-containing protein [Pseudomonas sp. 273]